MLYFIEGEKSLTDGVLQRHGLTSVIQRPRCREVLRDGPGNSTGLLVGESGPGEFRYEAGNQTWLPRYGFRGTHVGYWNNAKPGPAELAKPDPIPGVPLTLLDGNRWNVPLLRQWREEDEHIVYDCQLPTVLERSIHTGRLVSGQVVHPLRSLWERSCSIADDLIEQMKTGAMAIDTDKVDGFIADLMSCNYRLTLDEIGLLGLLDDKLYADILFAALDWDRMRDLAGNLRRRLLTAGASQGSSNSTTESGRTPPTEADSIPTAQP